MRAILTAPRAKALLRRELSFARHVEQVLLRAHQRTPLQQVCYGSLVRGRRLADAAHALAHDWTYEGRVLLRSLVEIYGNYAWMRLQPYRRPNRFIKYLWVERYRIADAWPADEEALSIPELRRELRGYRSEHRRLFRYRDAKGKLKWAKDWAFGQSFEARLKEVDASAKPRDDQIYGIAYGLYRWLSGVVHGSPGSFVEAMTYTRYGLRPKVQPEPTPAAMLLAHSVMLLGILSFASRDMAFSYSMKSALSGLRLQILRGAGFEVAPTK